ncbi:hypothetical protein DFJ58DRAFT_658712, partial [Suillus subalutaceus]|uniref:uncharacterized protein n=1 Tax=Suillus subalutaceus TaxID=48586 RepID=UPI001B87AB85
SPITHHCMNHLRRSILYHPNMRIEPVVNKLGSAVERYETVCHDWTNVHEVYKLHATVASGV